MEGPLKHLTRRWIAPVLAIGLLAGACSADDDADVSAGGSGNDNGADCQNGPGVTDTTIKLGVTTPQSGPSATIGKQHLVAQEAFVATVNDKGGINGRKLELVNQDDGFDPQRAVTNAQYLIDQAGVFAIWGNVGSAQSSAVLPVTEASKTPFLFPYALGRDMTTPTKPYVFSIATPAFVQNQALSQYMAQDPKFKGKKVGLLVINSQDGQETADGFKAGPAADQTVSTQTYERNVTTFKSQLLAFKQAGAEVIYTGVADTQFAKILSEANELGMLQGHTYFGSTGTVTNNTFTLAKELAEGAYGLVFAAQNAAGDEPGAKALRDAMAKHKPGEQIGTFSVHAWLSGLILEEALKDAGDCVNADTLKKAMEGITGFDTGGLSGPISFGPDKHLGNQSIKVLEAKGGAWTPVSDWITVK